MIDIKRILPEFRSLVGWDDSHGGKVEIATELTTSDSGLYFQEAHPLLTLRAMDGIKPKDWGEGYPLYDVSRTYAKGEKVKSNGTIYVSKVANNKGRAVTEELYWEEYSVLSDYLAYLRDNGIKTMLNRFQRDKVIGMETKNIVDKRTLFDGAGSINARTPNQKKIVGFEITPLRAKGITMKIDKIGLQFVGNTGEIKFYLFHSSSAEPIWTKTFNYSNNKGSYMWFDVEDLYLPYVTEGTMNGGSWYLCYNQVELPDYMESVNFQRDWSREPCGSCNKGDAQLYRLMGKYVEVSPFCISTPKNWDETLWDITANAYTPTDNYGINIQFTIGCDITDTLIETKSMFAETLQLQVAHNALRALALNPEVAVNRVQYNADRASILFESEGNGEGIKGLHHELERSYKALSFSTKGMDEACLTCHNGGIKIRSI